MVAANPVTGQAVDRAYGVTNIKHHIPVILDTKDHNYDAWRELFLTHCLTFDVLNHVDGTPLATGVGEQAWKKKDGLVKLWIYGTMSKDLFRSCFKSESTAYETWLRIENDFRNNKEARAIQLDNELRIKMIGDMSVREYCQALKEIADRLANVDVPVSEQTLVTYMINGLSAKYDNIVNVIMRRVPFPTFEIAKSMLQLEEDILARGVKPHPSNNDTRHRPLFLLFRTHHLNTK